MDHRNVDRFICSWCIPMGIPVAAILKGVDMALAALQIADKACTKVKRWNKQRKIRLVKEIKKK